MIKPPFTTNRLIIRRPRKSDASRMAELLNDESVVTYLATVPFPYHQDDAVAFIESANGAGGLPPRNAFVIVGPDGGDIVGGIGVRPSELSDGTTAGEIGYWLGRDSWGRGYATEAVEALLPYCFHTLALDRVTASVDVENTASCLILEKAGFRATAMIDGWYPARGAARKSILMVLESGRWKAAQGDALPILTVVAVALLDGDDRVLVTQRPAGKSMAGLWEFPGGKIADGESPEAALIRELDEELGIDTERSCLAPFCFASHRYEDFHLLMPLFVCRVWKGQPQGREGQALKWVAASDLAELAMPAADVPLVAMLRDFL
jgi:8-oxo-dGTP diphosphatase